MVFITFFFFFKKKEIWRPDALGYSSSASLKFVDPFCTTSLHPAFSAKLNSKPRLAFPSTHPSSVEESRTCTFQPSYKNLPALSKTQVQSLGQEYLLEKEMATHSSILAWRIPWTEQPGGPQSMRSHWVGQEEASHSTQDCWTAHRVPSAGHIWKQGKESFPRWFKKRRGPVM